MMDHIAVKCALLLLTFALLAFALPAQEAPPIAAPNAKPCTYWWWLGNAVDEKNITWNLEQFAKAGLGGVHIIPIYGIKGEESRHIDFLSPKWTAMLAHTLAEADRLGLSVDMSTGTGWPFGGAMVCAEDSAQRIVFKRYPVEEGNPVRERFKPSLIGALRAISEKGECIDLVDRLSPKGKLNWSAPGKGWSILAGLHTFTGQKVKRAAPGGVGPVLNPFSLEGLSHYQEAFDAVFAKLPQPALLRAQYHDSFEYYKANWSAEVWERFESLCGYDARDHLPALMREGASEYWRRVCADYQRTISSLHRDYIAQWTAWAHEHGQITRDQAHGSPGNLLDIYAAADIPETEIFGSSAFPIPGLRVDPKFNNARPNPLVLKFASSAAHVSGKPLISSETCTWLAEHFQTALSQAKPEIDQLFTSGINHIFYHGIPYSPQEAAWPGWLFYASTHFGPSNPFFDHFSALNAYVERCQTRLREGEPANEILLYFPVEDIWYENDKEDLIHLLTVHDESWPEVAGLQETGKSLFEAGYGFDFISDAQLQKLQVLRRYIYAPAARYRLLVIPPCEFMPIKTIKTVLDILGEGGAVVFLDHLPAKAPGYQDYAMREQAIKALWAKLRFETNDQGDQESDFYGGRCIISKDLCHTLDYLAVPRCPLAEKGIRFIKRRDPKGEGETWFLSNLSGAALSGKQRLETARKTPLKNPAIYYPMHETGGAIPIDAEGHITFTLAPGESCFITSGAEEAQPPYVPVSPQAPSLAIDGPWKITFLTGGPELPEPAALPHTASWTTLEAENAGCFSGTACYETTFELPENVQASGRLHLGRVRESARVFLNGKEQGVAFAAPFDVPLAALKAGQNTLAIEVSNVGANRIRRLDQQQVNWKKFHDINFVNILYKEFDASKWPIMDAGLLDPLNLQYTTE